MARFFDPTKMFAEVKGYAAVAWGVIRRILMFFLNLPNWVQTAFLIMIIAVVILIGWWLWKNRYAHLYHY